MSFIILIIISILESSFILKLNEFYLGLDNEEDFALIQLKMKDLEIEKLKNKKKFDIVKKLKKFHLNK